MPAPRSGALIAIFLAVTSLALTGAPQGFVAPGFAAPGGDGVEALQRQASKARSDLEKATKQWEGRKKQLVQSQAQLRATLRELGGAEAELNRLREPLARLANASYQQPGSAGSMAIFGGGSSDDALRTAADVTAMANGQDALIKQATELQKRRAKLTSTAQDLQSRNAVEEAKLQQQVEGLKQRSTDLTRQLTNMLNRMRADRDKRLTLGCDKGLAADAKKFPNGLIPARYLCPLPQKGMMLRADAALAFYKLNAAYKKHFGRDMCVTSSYRSLANQQRIYNERPGFAAIPGRSNHGLGQAVDLCGGIQNQGSVPFNWLRANSQTYGWFHPSWAYSSPFEPWHWEFGTEAPR